ncbi:F0F1 ATP synthase subunit B [Cyanobacterium stanieri LEGE 03274]|uniref:ATP synthase subunit b n=1 Tax=Cyanobacterium stanieri LEGE 03274 TaxID=1828756 RepID=A0ABR9V141_9CHRO|nr:F0F1 ATP synthase subunit B [Cyanobacterium stanieri]MBE9221572.1 F0F1 ATP synthase subunit B [Cyanobacterium stanieri LEGE 03274]
MLTLFYLATESAEGGFGLSSDILGSNLINLIIVIGLLVVYGGKFVGNLLEERRKKIAQEIQEAEQQAADAAKALAEGQKNLNEAQERAKKIISDAQATAGKVREEILAQGQKDIERMKTTAVQELDSERAKVVNELKRTIAVLALEKAEQQLKETLTDEVQGKIISRAVEQLGG